MRRPPSRQTEMRMGGTGLKSAASVKVFKAIAGDTPASPTRRALRPNTAIDAIRTLMLCSMVLALASCAEPFSSHCTNGAVEVIGAKTIVLQKSVSDPAFSQVSNNQVIVIGKRAAEKLLREREESLSGKQDVASSRPLSDGPKTILGWLHTADPDAPIPVNQLMPPIEGVSLQTLNSNLVVYFEYQNLLTEAVLRGEAMIMVDQQPVPEAIASWYSAHDDFGVTNGVRIGVGTTTFRDSCNVTPHQD